MKSLPERLEAGARADASVTFITGDDAITVPYSKLHAEALEVAGSLQAMGIGPGSRVALLGPTTRPLVTAIRGIWMAGATLVVLPLPMRLGSIEAFVAQTRDRIRHAEVSAVLIDPDLAPFVEPAPDDPPLVTYAELAAQAGANAFTPCSVGPEDLGVLQFTSGSTENPKGVMLPQHTISANLDAIAEAAGMTSDDVMVSWLPLYHDMGLIGFCMLPMAAGVDLVLGAPQDFMARPVRWMEWLSRYRGTATAGPNFSWVLATRALKRAPQMDLSALRIGLNGAEPVDPGAVRAFVAAGARHGLRPGAVYPAFGMAEVVIGAAFPPPMRGLATDPVDRLTLEAERFASPADPADPRTRELVKLGYPLPGLAFRIVDPENGEVLPERAVGELQISGTSVSPGYWQRPDANAVLFDDGWLRTGDLGYLVDGELVICGRIKDLIIVGGRNVYPEEVERAVGECEGVRAGNVVAFGVPGRAGKEELVVVAEARDVDEIDIRSDVAKRVRNTVGLPAKDIVLVPPGTVPKTSSGKLQRSACREQYEADLFA
ncbi:MAG: fatty acyl-AMP ligase [Acidimicrobiales bacterium]